MDYPSNPRAPIEEMIRRGDLRGLLLKAGELHGHFCPYVSLGVRAGYAAFRALGLQRNAGMEDIVAIVETNNCFSDGIQVVTGCTFANNALIYRDLGKTAVTVTTREGRGVRVALQSDYDADYASRHPEAAALFDKIVTRRETPTSKESARFRQLWSEASFALLEIPEERILEVKPVDAQAPAFAPIYASVLCAVCGEKTMETRAVIRDGAMVCMACAGASHYVLDGAGIHMCPQRNH